MWRYQFTIDEKKGYFCEILPESPDDLAINVISEEEALENGEACIQLLEGTVYEYRLSEGLIFKAFPGFIQPSGFNSYTGRINTGISVGTVCLQIIDEKNNRNYDLFLEIRSKKLTYRKDYRFMLEAIAEKCTDLLMINNATSFGNFSPDYSTDPKTAYQRFAFVKSFFDSEEFDNAIVRILQDPVTDWIERFEKTDIR